MKRVFKWFERHWAKIAIAIALLLLGGSKLRRTKRRAKVAGELYRAEITSDLSTLSDANRRAKGKAKAASRAAREAKEIFKGRVNEIANSDDDIGDILSDYRKRVRK